MEQRRIISACISSETGDMDIKVNFTENNEFFVEGTDISGLILDATDDLLEPEVPKTSNVLVNSM